MTGGSIIDVDCCQRTKQGRDHREVSFHKTSFSLEQWQDRLISHASFCMQEGDRLVAFSDGISQAGMGSPTMPLGWGREAVVERALQLTRRDPQMSSRQLAGGAGGRGDRTRRRRRQG
jgi:hypothetical protein